MQLVIEIPKEFERDWNCDKFQDCFERVLADLGWTCCASGKYEKETIKMLKSAFRDAKESIPKWNGSDGTSDPENNNGYDESLFI